MKNLIFISIIPFLLYSCSLTSTFNNEKLQKRKYTKGVYLNKTGNVNTNNKKFVKEKLRHVGDKKPYFETLEKPIKQKEKENDTLQKPVLIKLKNRTILIGKIISSNEDETVLKQAGDSIINIPSRKIRKTLTDAGSNISKSHTFERTVGGNTNGKVLKINRKNIYIYTTDNDYIVIARTSISDAYWTNKY